MELKFFQERIWLEVPKNAIKALMSQEPVEVFMEIEKLKEVLKEDSTEKNRNVRKNTLTQLHGDSLSEKEEKSKEEKQESLIELSIGLYFLRSQTCSCAETPGTPHPVHHRASVAH
ncbi:hypothetical protein MHYP_G00156720 [Metynnis hypsauchen]